MRRNKAVGAALIVTSIVTLVLTGCATDPAGGPTAEKEIRPSFPPGPTTGELFEGQIRVHTRGTQGDALGADIAPLGDLIAYSWNDHQSEPKVYVVPSAGGPPRQVTFGEWADIHPEFAPSADPKTYRIAFASAREGNFDIYMVPLSGAGGAWQLTKDPADELHPSFSPDGRYLIFSRRDHDAVWKIWRLDLTTQLEVSLGPGSNPEWSPTGDRIAFQLPSGRERKLWSVWTMREDGTERTQVVAGHDFGAIHPTWSPDGRFLAVARIPAGQDPERMPRKGDILILDGRTGATYKLTTTACVDTDPCWSLDGWVYFSSTRTTGRFNLLSGRIASTMLRTILSEETLLPTDGGAR